MRSVIVLMFLGFCLTSVAARVIEDSKVTASVVDDPRKEDQLLGIAQRCPKDSITIVQSPTLKDPSGTTTFTLEIINACSTGCAVSNIHLRCGSFSSNPGVNENLLRRIRYDDCLVNNGKPLAFGQAIFIHYTNNFGYRFSVSSFSCN